MKKNSVVIVVAVFVAIAAFFGGMQYGKAQVSQRGAGTFAGQGQGGRAGVGMGANRAGGGFTNGVVLSMDDKSVTLKLPTGGSKIILLSDTTQVVKSVDGTKADIKTGVNLAVTGTANTDGSVTAQNIQIRPAPITPVITPGQTPVVPATPAK